MEQRDADQLQRVRIERKQREFARTRRALEFAAWTLSIEEAAAARRKAVIAEAEALTETPRNASQRPSLLNLIDTWLAEQERRHGISQSSPEALQKTVFIACGAEVHQVAASTIQGLGPKEKRDARRQ